MIGALAIAGKLFGLLQQDTGDNVIDLIGPIDVVAGDDLDLVLTVTDDTDARVNLAGLAGDDIRVRVSDSDGGAALLELTIGSGVTLLDQTPASDTEGQAAIAFTGVQTDRAAQLYYLEASVKVAGKRQHLVASRPFTVKPAIAAVAP